MSQPALAARGVLSFRLEAPTAPCLNIKMIEAGRKSPQADVRSVHGLTALPLVLTALQHQDGRRDQDRDSEDQYQEGEALLEGR
jgi:hypothetical protein